MIAPIALPGGALLLEEIAAGARSFALGFWFPLGSRHEAPSERGFVHFVEHMVFKGSSRRSAQDFARAVDRVGGYLNAFTERDTLCFYCIVPAEHWRLALDVLTDLVLNAVFPEDEFAREQSVIVSEILAASDDPEEASHDALLERIWPGDSLSLKIAGEVEDIEAATRDSLFEFYRRRLRTEHLVVSSSGPTDGGRVAEELGSLFAKLGPSRGPALPYPPEPTPRFASPTAFLPARISQVYLYEAVQMDRPATADDYYVLSVLNGAFGESMSSRLFQNLREKSGLCYSVYSTFSIDRGLGLWVASASSSARLFPRLLEALDGEIDRIARGGEGSLGEEEVSESVSRIAGSFDLALEDPEYRMKRLARQLVCNGFVLDAEETRRKILAVGKTDVDDLAQRLLAAAPRARFAYGKRSAGVEAAMGIAARGPKAARSGIAGSAPRNEENESGAAHHERKDGHGDGHA